MNWFNIYAGVYDLFNEIFRPKIPNKVLNILKPEKNDTVLDIGGGTGFIAAKVAKKAKRVVVLDSSKAMLSYAKKYKNLEISHSTATKIPYKDNEFNTVLLIDSLHHIKDYTKTLKESFRVLKPGGKILVLEFHIKGIRGFFFWLFEKIWIDNSKFIKPEALQKKMEKQGFSGKIIPIAFLEYVFIGHKKS